MKHKKYMIFKLNTKLVCIPEEANNTPSITLFFKESVLMSEKSIDLNI